MAKVVSQVHTVIDVLAVLSEALDNKNPDQLEALTRKVNDWIMLDSEKAVILEHITSVEATIEDCLLAGEYEETETYCEECGCVQ